MTEREMGIEQARPVLGQLAAEAATDGTVTVLLSHRIPVAAIVPLRMVSDSPLENTD